MLSLLLECPDQAWPGSLCAHAPGSRGLPVTLGSQTVHGAPLDLSLWSSSGQRCWAGLTACSGGAGLFLSGFHSTQHYGQPETGHLNQVSQSNYPEARAYPPTLPALATECGESRSRCQGQDGAHAGPPSLGHREHPLTPSAFSQASLLSNFKSILAA